MSDQDNCPNGNPDCDFAEKHELALAGGILRVIENYTKENETYPCPKCLRNSIMAIAALLHIEAEKMDGNEPRDGSPDQGLAEAFAEAARDRILSVMNALVDLDDLLCHRRLM